MGVCALAGVFPARKRAFEIKQPAHLQTDSGPPAELVQWAFTITTGRVQLSTCVCIFSSPL